MSGLFSSTSLSLLSYCFISLSPLQLVFLALPLPFLSHLFYDPSLCLFHPLLLFIGLFMQRCRAVGIKAGKRGLHAHECQCVPMCVCVCMYVRVYIVHCLNVFLWMFLCQVHTVVCVFASRCLSTVSHTVRPQYIMCI